MKSVRWLMNERKKRGARTETWAAPDVTGHLLEAVLLRRQYLRPLARMAWIQDKTLGERLRPGSLVIIAE